MKQLAFKEELLNVSEAIKARLFLESVLGVGVEDGICPLPDFLFLRCFHGFPVNSAWLLTLRPQLQAIFKNPGNKQAC